MVITTKMLLENTRELNVLYVEDDKPLAILTGELLNAYFKRVDLAYDGKSGLEKYNNYKKENDYFYDLVITDINMPEMDGIVMSRAILSQNQTQSIIIVTAYNSTEYLVDSIGLGIDGYITKPIDNDQLFKSLFKASQAVHDHKMVEKYISQVEELNIELNESNKELLSKNQELEKSLRMLDTALHKDTITQVKPKDEDHIQVNEETIRKNEDIKSQIEQLISDDLFELREILNEIDVSIIEIINNIGNIDQENLNILIKHFARYAAILNYYTFFDELSTAMMSFSKTMQSTPLPEDKDVVHNVFIFLETFVYVLSKWQDDLSAGSETEINQLDASIISDMHTIINMWTQTQEEVAEEDLDDIFDF